MEQPSSALSYRVAFTESFANKLPRGKTTGYLKYKGQGHCTAFGGVRAPRGGVLDPWINKAGIAEVSLKVEAVVRTIGAPLLPAKPKAAKASGKFSPVTIIMASVVSISK
jgi:hypothetical protein